MTRDHLPGTILTFVLGVGVGSVAALLFAPKSGEELRGDIAKGVSDGVHQIRSTGIDLKQRAQKLVDLAKDHVQDAMKAGHNAHRQAKRA